LEKTNNTEKKEKNEREGGNQDSRVEEGD